MKTVIVVRHAKSSWAEQGISDFDRSLNNRGKKDAPEMAQRLRKKDIPIDLFISSPAKRARRTAQLFAEEFNYPKEKLVLIQELYLADVANFKNVISNIPLSVHSIIIFSHNPGITEFANTLTTFKIDNMPTCSVLGVSAKCDNWKDFESSDKEFLFYDYPKAL